jgi:hypothetical protein
LERGIWDLLSRLTFWKLERLEKEKSLVSDDFLEAALSEDTAETPSHSITSIWQLIENLAIFLMIRPRLYSRLPNCTESQESRKLSSSQNVTKFLAKRFDIITRPTHQKG